MLHAKQFWYKPYTDSTDATKSDNITNANSVCFAINRTQVIERNLLERLQLISQRAYLLL